MLRRIKEFIRRLVGQGEGENFMDSPERRYMMLDHKRENYYND